jgi:hypothetical protein
MFSHCRLLLICAALAVAACGGDKVAGPVTVADQLVLTDPLVKSLDSTAQVIVQANSGDPELKSLVDSTLLTLSSGVTMQRLDVSTDLTSRPLYFVIVHRAVSHTGGSFSTWTLVGFDDPAHLGNLIEVSGFAQSSTTSAPSSVSGTIGDGTGIVNAMLIQVGNGGTVTKWNAGSGTASFSSDSPGATCPSFTAQPRVTCSLESSRVHFSANASSGSAGSRRAAIASDVSVPGIRLTFTP